MQEVYKTLVCRNAIFDPLNLHCILAKLLTFPLFPNTHPQNFSGINYFSMLLLLMTLFLRLIILILFLDIFSLDLCLIFSKTEYREKFDFTVFTILIWERKLNTLVVS